MQWIRNGAAVPHGAPGEPDGLQAWQPWVLEEPDGTLRMWYTGNDGTTSRILEAVQAPDGRWERRGTAIDAGFAGDTDSYGAESPCVVRTPGGYLMAYGGFDGEVGRLHMATSADARRWEPQGTIMQRGPEDSAGATHPCLLPAGDRWWLFYTGTSEAGAGPRSVLVAAISQTGASWDRVGTVLEPEPGETSMSHPCALEVSRTVNLFYASDAGGSVRIALATSHDGVSWDRRGTVLEPAVDGPDAGGVHSPCLLRRRDGTLEMWYAGLPAGDDQLGYNVCSARFPSPWAG